jgi:hypothetical protein
MRLWITLLTGLFLFVSLSFSMDIRLPKFPFKAFVFENVGIQSSDVAGLTIAKDTKDTFEFTFNAKKYKASLYAYGAIYLEREGLNPLLISFNVRDFRLDGHFEIIIIR